MKVKYHEILVIWIDVTDYRLLITVLSLTDIG